MTRIMLQKFALVLSIVLWISSCKKPDQASVTPEQGEEQPEPEALIIRQNHEGGLGQAIKCTDGNIVAYTSYPNHLVKLSSRDGSQMWKKNPDIPGLNQVKGIAPLPDGGFVMSGTSSTWGTITLVAFDANGNETWARNYTDSNYTLYESYVAEADHGNIMIIARGLKKNTPSNSGLYIMLVNSNGAEISKTFHRTDRYYMGNTIGLNDNSILSTYNWPSGTVAAVGGCMIRKFKSTTGLQDSAFIIETGKDITLYDMIQMPDGTFICSGLETPTGTQTYTSFLMRLNSDLDVLEKKTVHFDTLQSYLFDIVKAKNGVITVGYGTTGDKNYPIAMKVDGALNVQWQRAYPTKKNLKEELYFVYEVEGRYVAAGSSWNGTNIFEHFLMDLSESGKAKE